VVSSCDYGDEPSGSGVTELVCLFYYVDMWLNLLYYSFKASFIVDSTFSETIKC
jgi:hypothetical protein